MTCVSMWNALTFNVGAFVFWGVSCKGIVTEMERKLVKASLHLGTVLFLLLHEVIQGPSYPIHLDRSSKLGRRSITIDIHHRGSTCEFGSSRGSPQYDSQASLPPPKVRNWPWNFTQELVLQPEPTAPHAVATTDLTQIGSRNFTQRHCSATLAKSESAAKCWGEMLGKIEGGILSG